MRLYFIAFFIFLTYLAFSQETFPINGVKDNFHPIYAFTNAHIIISPGEEIVGGTLLIQNKKIIQADSLVDIPYGAIVKNLNGDYIYPSFVELYSEYGLEKAEKKSYSSRPQYASKKSGAYHWNQAIHPEIIAANRFKTNPKIAKSYLEIGFGTVLTHQQDGIFRGSGALVSLSSKKENENILRSEAASFYSFQKGVSRQRYPTSLMGSIALIRQTILDAEWYKKMKRKDMNLSLAAYNKQKELPQIFASRNPLDYSRIYKIADEFEINYIVKGNGKEYSRIVEIKETGFPIIVPINFPESYDVSNPEKTEWISLGELKEWEASPFNPIILEENGIIFCLSSTDLENKKDFLKNLRKSIEKGLSKQSALKALTITPSELIGAEHLIGTLEPGKLANFIITSSDIFEDGIIYENWTNGERNVITKKQEIDIQGYYTFNSIEFKNVFVKITGKKENIKTEILELDSLHLKTQLNEKEVVLATSNGDYRMAGVFSEEIIKGSYQNKEGKYFAFAMQRDSIILKKKKSSKIEVDNTRPAVWFPNKAYGKIQKNLPSNAIFRNATVWTNEKIGIVTQTDVAIKNGKIIAIGNELEKNKLFPNKNVRDIDATNKHLTSGIIDEHSHIAISRGVNESSQAVTAEVNIGDVINPEDINIYRQLAGGVTAVQLLHGSANPIGGKSAIIKLRWGESAENMKIEDSDGFIKFALGENVKQSNWGDYNKIRFPQTRMGVEQVFYDAFYRAKEYEKKWKKYNSLSLRKKRLTTPPREDLELNTLVEILNSKRFVTCHSYMQSEINMLMHVADSMGFKINTFTHILEGYKVAKKMKQHGVGASTFSDWWAYKFEVNDAIPYNAALLHNAGVITAINSDDAEMGRRLNQEAAKAIKYGGISEEDAWKMVTLNPAKLLHLDNRMGSIKVGKDADLVLWSGHPLSIYSVVEKTYVDGSCLFDKKENIALMNRDLKEKMRIIQKMSQEKGEKKIKDSIKKPKIYHCDTIEEHEE